jgi:hypothetical protein
MNIKIVILLFTILSVSSSNCQNKPKIRNSMYTIGTFFKTGWSSGLKEEFVSPPETSLYNPAKKEVKKIRRDIFFRIQDNYCLILSGDFYVSDSVPEWNFLLIHGEDIVHRKITINRPLLQNRIIDFVITGTQLIGVLAACTSGNSSKLLFITSDREGRQAEREIIPPAGQPYFEIRKIRMLGNDVFFDAKISAGAALYKMQDNGQLEEIYQNKHAFGIFLKDRENLLVALSSDDYTEHYWALVNTASGQETVKATAPSLKAHIAIPVFCDDAGNTYSVHGNEMARLNIHDQSVTTFDIQNIIPLADGEFMVCRGNQTEITAFKTKEGVSQNQGAVVFTLPEELAPVNRFIIINTDKKNNFIAAVKKKDEAEFFLSYTAEGVFKERLETGGDINAYSLQRTPTWQADEKGNLYLPVSDSGGFRILRITSFR